MKTALVKIGLRQHAVYIADNAVMEKDFQTMNESTTIFVANCTKLGYTFTEDLLRRMNGISPISKVKILEALKEVKGVHKGWTPLVKQWDVATGETKMDHIITFLSNVFKSKKGTILKCGHAIPNNTFPLERYNGCPYCGTPFVSATLKYNSTKNKLTVLHLWNDVDMVNYLKALLTSSIALDATQIDSLKVLLKYYDLPEEVVIKMKETLMIVIDVLVGLDKGDQASKFFKNPNEVLRYLWYKHTGFLQIVEPKTIVERSSKNSNHLSPRSSAAVAARISATKDLKLKFNRKECKQYATWLNAIEMDIYKQCEIMHPKRGIWIRVIRALRLAEYSKRKGLEKLAALLDVFYNQDYEVWTSKVNDYKFKMDSVHCFTLLKQRPGLFARALFSTMLWFGKEETEKHFREVMHLIPPRLMLTLNMYADFYFDKEGSRVVKPLGGTNKKIPKNQLLQIYSNKDLSKMIYAIKRMTKDQFAMRFEEMEIKNSTIYIAPELYKIPISVGDRSAQLQDLPQVPTGTRFSVEGSKVRLFMQWGNGLKAQHLDMDLSCKVAYENKTEFCSYSKLVIPGCKHSGDIINIPHMVGTAEYIDIDIDQLADRNAKYVSFTCNAYSNGAITPNLVVGWMNSKYPMKITKQGVAYEPSTVQHQVRVTQSLAKGMLFGVLDVQKREIIWMELEFGGQVVQNLNMAMVKTLTKKLEAKIKIGELLDLKATIQGLVKVDNEWEADEKYDMQWMYDLEKVNALFFD